MHKNVIDEIEAVSSSWLTEVLRKHGALKRGQVVALERECGAGNWSTNVRLNVTYSEGASGARPQKLFLKMAQADPDEEDAFGDSEVTFYARDYVDVADAPLVTCYDAAFSPELKRYHLLLDDLTDTHVVSAEKQPTLEYGLALAEANAILHARWWGAKRLFEAKAPVHSAEFIQRFIDISTPGADHILARDPNDLKPHWPALIHDLIANHPAAIKARAADVNGFTLIHGDPGEHNILVPRTETRPIYIIDRQPFNWSLTTWLGVYDLAYAIVLDWDSDLRRQCELPILRHYHAHLLQRGITNYSWERLYDDYRLCVAMCVYIALEYCRGGVNKKWFHVWLLMLQRSLTACDELACSELW